MELGPLADYITEAADLMDLIPIMFLLFSKSLAHKRVWLSAYLISNLFLLIISIYLARLGSNNMWVYHLIGLCELIFIYLYFRSSLRITPFLKVTFWIILAFYISQSMFFIPLEEINALARGVSILFLLTLCLYSFYETYKNQALTEITTAPDFWIACAFLMYTSGTFFAFLLSYESLFNNNGNWYFTHGTWILLSAVQIVKCLILATGFGFYLRQISQP